MSYKKSRVEHRDDGNLYCSNCGRVSGEEGVVLRKNPEDKISYLCNEC